MNRIEKNFEKLGMYILSLWFLFVMSLLVTVSWSLGENYNFHDSWDKWLRFILMSCLVWGGIYYARFSYKLKGAYELPTKIIRSKNINSEHLIFLVTFMVPLMVTDFSKPQCGVIYLLLLILTGAVYLRGNLFYVNPTLAVLGYQIQIVTINPYGKRMEGLIFMSREKISVGESIKYKKLNDQIFFAKKVSS